MPKDSYFRIYKSIFKLNHVLHVCLALIFASREEHHRDCCKSFKGRRDPFGAKNGSASRGGAAQHCINGEFDR